MIKILLHLAIFLILSNSLFSQEDELNSVAEDLKQNIQTVQASKSSYEQIVRSPETGIIELTRVETNTKGIEKDRKYEFNLADVDQYTVRTETKRDVIAVVIGIKAEQKLVKSYEDGAVKSYEKELEILVPDIDNGRSIVEIIKRGISPAEKQAEQKLSLSSYEESISWLEKNLNRTKASGKTYDYYVLEGEVAGQLVIGLTTTDAKSKTVEKFVFNIADINPNSLQFKISGSRFYLTFEIDRQRKLISNRKNGELKPYTKNLDIIVNSVEEARDLRTALELLIPMAEKELKGALPSLETKEETMTYLQQQISNFTDGDQTINQKFNTDCITEITVVEKDLKKSEENIFQLNLMDLNVSTTDFEVKGKDIVVNPLVKEKNKFIKHYKNGELMNYEEQFSVFSPSIENGRRLSYALRKAIEFCSSGFVSKVPKGSKNEKLEWIIGNIPTASSVGDKTYKQSISCNESKPDKLTFNRIEITSKNSTEEIFEFNLSDLDPDGIAIDVSGKWISVELNSKYDQKIFNYYKDGETKNYQSAINIFTEDIETARNLKVAFEEVVVEISSE
ncbi:MAG: hypothetical protein AAF363_06830 [Bacteroidota bacterium]